MTAQPPVGPAAADGAAGAEAEAGVLRTSSVMAVGTVISRITGVLRTTALAAALGSLGVLADAYNTANTLPNIIYIMVAGGALNAVFIPQLVAHMKDDEDGGRSYADRLLTLVATTLLVITVLAVLAAPWLARLYAGSSYSPRQLEVLTAKTLVSPIRMLTYEAPLLGWPMTLARFIPGVLLPPILGVCGQWLYRIFSSGTFFYK